MKLILSLLLVFCTFNTQAQNLNDTIKIKKDIGNIYIYDGKKLKPKQMLSLMEPNPLAYKEMKRAKTNYDVGAVFGFAGGFLVGWSLGALLADKEIDWRISVAGAGLIGISIPFSIGQARHTKRAVKIFNDGRKARTSSIQFMINGSNNKIGIVANF